MTTQAETDANNTECKGCSATVHVTAEEIAKLFGETLRVKNVKLTTDTEYERRLTACHACEAFQFGTTCRWCGCLMDIKAKLTAARCPDPSGSRWVEVDTSPTQPSPSEIASVGRVYGVQNP